MTVGEHASSMAAAWGSSNASVLCAAGFRPPSANIFSAAAAVASPLLAPLAGKAAIVAAPCPWRCAP
eukprot:6644414-Pyramimonas_sp.AAC.1